MFGGKRIAELEEQVSDLQNKHGILAGWNKALGQEMTALKAAVEGLQEQARLAGRKKVRRRDPQTGRFESVFEDELESA